MYVCMYVESVLEHVSTTANNRLDVLLYNGYMYVYMYVCRGCVRTYHYDVHHEA